MVFQIAVQQGPADRQPAGWADQTKHVGDLGHGDLAAAVGEDLIKQAYAVANAALGLRKITSRLWAPP